MDLILPGVIFSSIVLAGLMGAGQLLIRDRNAGNVAAAVMLGSIALILLEALLYYLPSGSNAHAALYGFLYVPRFLLGPVGYMYFRGALLGERVRIRRLLRHLLPAAACLALAATLLVRDLLGLAGLADECAYCTPAADSPTMRILRLFSEVSLVGYLFPSLLFLARAAVTENQQQSRGALIAASGVIATALVLLVLDVLGNFVWSAILWATATFVLALLVWAVLLIGYRYPEIIGVMQVQAMQLKKRPDLLRGVNTEELGERLRALMEEEKVYCDEDLQMNKVAEMLDIKPYRLTYFLNNVLRKNFSRYINEYRVAEAQRLLLEEPDRSILNVAYAVGFNSKTVFYKKFGEYAGMAPSEYRRKKLSRGKRAEPRP